MDDFQRITLIRSQRAAPLATRRARFTPTSISGLSLWLDGADASTVSTSGGSSVDSWRCKVNNSIVLVPVTAGVRPSFSNNGTGVLFTNPSRSGTTQSLRGGSITNAPLTENYTLICAWRPNRLDAVDTRRAVGVFAQRTPYTHHFLAEMQISSANHGLQHAVFTSDWGSAPVSSPFVSTQSLIQRTDILQGGSSCKSFTNGVETTARTGGTALNGTVGGTFNMNEVQVSVPSVAMDGNCYEVLMYSQTLTGVDRQRIEGYLAHKWGFQANLPVSHPFKNAAP